MKKLADVFGVMPKRPLSYVRRKGVVPPFVSYDKNDFRLKILDARQFFVLANINKKKLFAEIPDPREGHDSSRGE